MNRPRWGGSCTATPNPKPSPGWQYNCHPTSRIDDFFNGRLATAEKWIKYLNFRRPRHNEHPLGLDPIFLAHTNPNRKQGRHKVTLACASGWCGAHHACVSPARRIIRVSGLNRRGSRFRRCGGTFSTPGTWSAPHRARPSRRVIHGDVVLEAVGREEIHQLRKIGNLHHARCAEGVERIVGNFAVADASHDSSLDVIGRKPSESDRAGLSVPCNVQKQES